MAKQSHVNEWEIGEAGVPAVPLALPDWVGLPRDGEV